MYKVTINGHPNLSVATPCGDVLFDANGVCETVTDEQVIFFQANKNFSVEKIGGKKGAPVAKSENPLSPEESLAHAEPEPVKEEKKKDDKKKNKSAGPDSLD